MPVAALTAGFYGKLPSAGDFVARGLPPGFVAPWDRWLVRHVAGRLAEGAAPLYFRRAGPPPLSGVVLASRDRAGRRFPLTLAVAGAAPAAALADLAALGEAAIAEALAPDALAARLAALDLAPGGDPEPAALVLWTDPARRRAADPEAPDRVLDALIGPRAAG